MTHDRTLPQNSLWSSSKCSNARARYVRHQTHCYPDYLCPLSSVLNFNWQNSIKYGQKTQMASIILLIWRNSMYRYVLEQVFVENVICHSIINVIYYCIHRWTTIQFFYIKYFPSFNSSLYLQILILPHIVNQRGYLNHFVGDVLTVWQLGAVILLQNYRLKFIRMSQFYIKYNLYKYSRIIVITSNNQCLV